MSFKYSIHSGEKRNFHAWDYVVFGAVLVVSAVIGIVVAIRDRKKNTTEEFLLGGRSMNPVFVAMSLLSTYVSALSILGIPGEVYAYNTMLLMWTIIVMFVSILGAAQIFLPTFYNLGVTSVFEYVEMRFGKPTRIVGSLAYLLWMMLYMALVLYAPSLALNAVTGLSLWGSVIAVSLVCIFYTTMGGMKAVLFADTIQMVVVYVGIISVLIKGSVEVEGFGNAWNIADKNGRIVLWEVDPDPRVRHTVWSVLIGGSVFWCSMFGTNQAQVQRLLSVGSLKKAKLALWFNWPGFSSVSILLTLVGVVMYAFYAQCDPVSLKLVQTSDQMFPLFMMDMLGNFHGWPGLIIASIFSASLSTMSSMLNAASAVVLQDYAKPLCCSKLSPGQATLLSKALVVVFGLLSLALAYALSKVSILLIQLVTSISGVLGGPLLGVFSLGMLFPWANKWGGFFGLTSSLAFLIWIGVGKVITKTYVQIRSPLSTAGCPLATVNSTISTFTTIATTTPSPPLSTTHVFDKYSGVQNLYTMSYLWYSPLAVLTCVVVGLLVSLITGPTDPKTINPKLICPFFDVLCPYLPEKIRKPLRFGVRHGMVISDDATSNKVKKPLENVVSLDNGGPMTDDVGCRQGPLNNLSKDTGGLDNVAYTGSTSCVTKL